jgi:hypothetical protein
MVEAPMRLARGPMTSQSAPYVCPECGWRCAPTSSAPEEIVRCAVEIEKHLVGVHDSSFRTTNDRADDWTAQALQESPPKPKA